MAIALLLLRTIRSNLHGQTNKESSTGLCQGMAKNRARLLASIGFVFVMNKSDGRRSVLWKSKYQALRRF